MINQIRLHQIRHSDHYKYGIKVSRNHNQAMIFNRENGNTRWKDAEELELKQINQYNSFRNLGKKERTLQEHKQKQCIWYII